MLEIIIALVVWLVAALVVKAAVVWLYGRRIGNKVFMVIGFPFFVVDWLLENVVDLAYDFVYYIQETRKKTVFRGYFGCKTKDEESLQRWFEFTKCQLQEAFKNQDEATNKDVFVEQIKELKLKLQRGCEIAELLHKPHPILLLLDN